MAPSLNQVFNKFAGKEVQVEEIVYQTKCGPETKVNVSSADTVVAELKKAVEDMGLKLRLWLPGSMGTRDARPDRVNVRVNKEADGKYRIGSDFNIG